MRDWLGAGDSRSWVDTVLGVNSLSWHEEVERDDLTSCSQVMVELWTRKGEMGDGDGEIILRNSNSPRLITQILHLSIW